MTMPQALIASAIVVSVALLLVAFMRPAEAQRTGPFVLEHHSNTSALAGVFRLDTSTGDVSYCYLTPNNDLVCSRSVR